jgi:hypothetical protein
MGGYYFFAFLTCFLFIYLRSFSFDKDGCQPRLEWWLSGLSASLSVRDRGG